MCTSCKPVTFRRRPIHYALLAAARETGNVRITVTRCERGRVRLAVDAPAGVHVVRREVTPGLGPEPEPPPRRARRRTPPPARPDSFALAWLDFQGRRHVGTERYPSRHAAERAKRLLLRTPDVYSVRVLEYQPAALAIPDPRGR
jgi:hypothetical protein